MSTCPFLLISIVFKVDCNTSSLTYSPDSSASRISCFFLSLFHFKCSPIKSTILGKASSAARTFKNAKRVRRARKSTA
ncbi:unnamed protein product [Schistosoma curassoni]|uniref:Secreted protein n=1 Tax=Schistosoma curassoni TaxID=6186 RepID=A0A183KJ82_9TREM|nr:unnamed protein product [Schistosoma curassoni]